GTARPMSAAENRVPLCSTSVISIFCCIGSLPAVALRFLTARRLCELAATGRKGFRIASQYPPHVMDLAVRLVVEDGLPYRPARWHRGRAHRGFVPFATIQTWGEAGGKKGAGAQGHRLPGLGVGGLFRL